MDRTRLRLLLDNINAFLLSQKSREVAVFLVFFVISAGFWLMQTLHEEYETEVHVALRLKDVPKGVVVTTDLPSTIAVRVKERGSTLLNYYFNGGSFAVDVSFSAHDRGVNYDHVVVSHSEMQKSVSTKLQSSTRILGFRPDTFDYYYTRGVEKLVPVVFRGHVTTDPLHYLAAITTDPDSVTVWGSERLLDSLESVSTMATNILDITKNTTQQVALETLRGTKVMPAEVNVTAEVDFYVESHVEVPVVGTNFPAGYALRTFPPSVTITFRVGSRDYKSITAENFLLAATYEELLARPDSILPLHLRSIPNGASKVRITPDRVQFLIEQTDSE